MRTKFALILTLCCVSLFATSPENTIDDKYISGIVLVESTASLDVEAMEKALSNFDVEITSSRNAVSFSMRQAEITVTKVDQPVAKAEWEPAAMISYIWRNAASEVGAHQAQLQITVSGKDHLSADLYKTFTYVAAAILKNSDAIGVYMNNQYLLLPKSYYLQSASALDDNILPVSLWVYFGMWEENGKNSGYTWGLQTFGKQELEIVGSGHGMPEVQAFLMETARTIIDRNQNLENGDRVGDEKKIVVRVSKGALIEGQTVKLDY